MAPIRPVDMRRPVRLVFRPLGRHKADGLAHICHSAPEELGKIEIDSNLRGRPLLETIIHELIHIIFPSMQESDVRRAGRYLALCLWAWGIRLDEDEIKALVDRDK